MKCRSVLFIGLLFGLLTLMLANNALAESNKPAPSTGLDAEDQDSPVIHLQTTTPTATLASPTPSLQTASTPWIFRFDSIYYGPSLENPSGADQPSDVAEDGGLSFRTFIRNAFALGYHLNQNLIIGAVTKIDVYPSYGVDYAFEDSYIRIMSPKMISEGSFSMLGDFRTYFPTSASQQAGGEVIAFQTRVVPSYVIPSSRLTFGAILYFQYTIRDSKVNGLDTFAKNLWTDELYAGPNVSYQLTPTVALTALYEFDTVRCSNDNGLAFETDTQSGNGYTDFEPGVSWDITPTINLSPFLNMYPGSNFNLATTSFNLWFSIKLL